MKRYIFLLITVFPIIIIALTFPLFYTPTKLSLAKLEKFTFYDKINTSGIIEESVKTNISSEFPLVIDQIVVNLGDSVKPQDTIATIDKSATIDAVLSMVQLEKFIPQNLDINKIEYLINAIPLEIKSTASGIITALNFSNGALCYPKASIATISKLDKLYAKLNITEEFANKININDTVYFKTSSDLSQVFTGKISRIAPTANVTIVGTSKQTNLSFTVNIDDTKFLRPGYNVSGVIVKKSRTINVLPYNAIKQDANNNEYVNILQDGKIHKCVIKTGYEFSDAVEIISGLSIYDVVVI